MAYNLVNAFRARRRACEEVLDESLDLDQQVRKDKLLMLLPRAPSQYHHG